jgi:hypothetical protein
MEAVDKGVREESFLTGPPSSMHHSLRSMAIRNENNRDALNDIDDL